MRRTMILVPVTALVGAAVLWLGSRDGSTPRPTDSTVSEGSIFEGASRLPPRVVDAGGVQVNIEPIELDEDGAVFAVALDTHEGDLPVDLARTTRLEVDGVDWGKPVWSGSPPGGHHREGELSFDPGGPVAGTARLTIDGLPDPVVAIWKVG